MKYIISDTETTGLIENRVRSLDKQPRIIEVFGLVCDEAGNEVDSKHWLIDPGFEIDKVITKITHIDQSMLTGQPKFASVANEIRDFLESADEVVFHNAPYDVTVIDFEFERLGLKVNWPKTTCTVEGTEHLKGHRMKLGDLYEYLFDERFTGAHRAEVDVRALARCFFELKNRGEI